MDTGTPSRCVSTRSVPVRSVPVRSVPVRSVPVRSVPVRSVPVRSVPVRLWVLLRFVLAGAVGNGAHALAFLLLGAATALPVAAVNVVAVALSTVLTNELHRRFTFHHGARTSWFKGHGVGGAAAVAGLVLSTAALTAWHHLVPGAGRGSGLLVVYAVTGLVGLSNFVLLRSVLRAPAQAVAREEAAARGRTVTSARTAAAPATS
ncbi:GtrA family protein [Kineococcus indalonis]|uniref:GtrA family protein n=1 Tax=Kineococcus indalonis TaxID=2696566 RepID=UPI001411E1B7|nr:GtrA family protein [Kineococcus indalonis]NAZ85251.1 hypothetical protein [Kineococcus indalonis]